MEFLANENFPFISIRRLRKAGHNVKSVIEDLPGSKDHKILTLAKDNNLVMRIPSQSGHRL